MLPIILPVVLPVFLIAGIGWAWGRSGHPFDAKVVSALATTVGAPALVLDSLLKVDIAETAPGRIALSALIVLALCAVAGWVILKIARQPVSTFLPGIVFGNTGNMGLPLCLFAFGDEGLALAVVYFVIHSIFMFTVGNQLAAGKASLSQVLRTPMLWAAIIAIPMMATGTRLPPALGNAVHLLGGMVIPLMLLALGVSLSQLRVRSLGRATVFSVLRLSLGGAAGWTVASLMGLTGTAFGVVVLESATPVAVFNYLFALRHGNRPEEVAGMVVVSTVLSFLILPLLLGLVMKT